VRAWLVWLVGGVVGWRCLVWCVGALCGRRAAQRVRRQARAARRLTGHTSATQQAHPRR
jgi:hypothetical protein